MIYTTLEIDITEDEKEVINKLLTNTKSYDKTLFLQLMDTKVRWWIDTYGKVQNIDKLFSTALTISILIMKINIQFSSEKWRFSIKSLVEGILQDYSDVDNKKDFIRVLQNDIEKYNKGQPRNFMRHTKKNNAYLATNISNGGNEKNYGNHLAHERYICEIEYFLKKERRKHARYYKLQEEINKYALKRIHGVPGWENLTIEKLNVLREIYSYLRPFFLKGEVENVLIPKCCYENYLDCFRLIYQYVDKYIPYILCDIAYFTLDYTYSLYSYIFLVFNGKNCQSCILNDNIIPFELRELYEYFHQECQNALNKIYLYMLNNQRYYGEGKNEMVGLLMKKFYHYFRTNKYLPAYDSPFNWIARCEKIPKILLDGLIVYNVMWNDFIMVTQSEFMKHFFDAANKIDSNYGIVQLSLELIGIDFSIIENKMIYDEIIAKITSAEREIKRDGMYWLIIC